MGLPEQSQDSGEQQDQPAHDGCHVNGGPQHLGKLAGPF